MRFFWIFVFIAACSQHRPQQFANAEQACGIDSRLDVAVKTYCLNIHQVLPASTWDSNKKNQIAPPQAALILFPGFTQSSKIFDLIPEKGISFARYLSDTFQLVVYLVDTRGTNGSDLPLNSTLDDVAIDDVETVVAYAQKNSPNLAIILGGHSQGSIISQAYLSGLQRCGSKSCFSRIEAENRAKKIAGALLFAGNVAMTAPANNPQLMPLLPQLSSLATISGIIRPFDRIPVNYIFRYLSPVQDKWWHPLSGKWSTAYWDLGKSLFLQQNVTTEVIEKFYLETVQLTTAGIIRQFMEGIENKEIRNSSSESYVKSLENIKVPVAQAAFSLDPLAPPEFTKLDSFSKIGSQKKEFFEYPDQSHEDFMLNPQLHKQHQEMVQYIISAIKK